jgi:glycosyltransferase involved in cell wall biosynthesis
MFSIKNHALFVDAAARIAADVPLARFVIVGDGALRHDIEHRVRRAGIADRVFFTGWRQDVAAIYADLAILAVTSNNEGTPVSAIEAMAAGVAVVATSVGGVPDLLRNGETGVLVPPRDVDALSRAVQDLLTDAERRRRMGIAARADVASRFQVGRMIRETHALYEDCLRGAAEHADPSR